MSNAYMRQRDEALARLNAMFEVCNNLRIENDDIVAQRNYLQEQNKALAAEVMEQARLLAMSAEREARLLAERDELKRLVEKLSAELKASIDNEDRMLRNMRDAQKERNELRRKLGQ